MENIKSIIFTIAVILSLSNLALVWLSSKNEPSDDVTFGVSLNERAFLNSQVADAKMLWQKYGIPAPVTLSVVSVCTAQGTNSSLIESNGIFLMDPPEKAPITKDARPEDVVFRTFATQNEAYDAFGKWVTNLQSYKKIKPQTLDQWWEVVEQSGYSAKFYYDMNKELLDSLAMATQTPTNNPE